MNSITNSVLYACFTISGLFGGTCINKVGPSLTLAISTTGYGLYIGGLWSVSSSLATARLRAATLTVATGRSLKRRYFSHTGEIGFPIFTGIYIGIMAGLLWTVAG